MSFERDDTQASSGVSRDARWLAAWYGQRKWTYWLLPLAALFVAISSVRRWILTRYCQKSFITPIIVIGNITVGGTGKTPLIIEMVRQLRERGYHPGVVSRGYGSNAKVTQMVNASSLASDVGDEPLSIYQVTQVPICVGADRVSCVKRLEDEGCDVILSDDGLQHYKLGRHLEIAVMDGQRGIGNGWRLPVGPLREPVSRLREMDWVIINNPVGSHEFIETLGINPIPMLIQSDALTSIVNKKQVDTHSLPTHIDAVAGIGNPERFKQTLSDIGFSPNLHIFGDHHAYTPADFLFAGERPVVMTHKDAVKCEAFAKPNWYYLSIRAQLPDAFWAALARRLERIHEHNKSRFPLR